MGKHHPRGVADGTEHVDGTGHERLSREASPVCFAVHRHPLLPAQHGGRVRRLQRGKGVRECASEQRGVEAGKEPLQCGLMGHHPTGKAEGPSHRVALGCPPLGNGKNRQVVGEDCRHGEGQQGGEGEASPLRPPGVGQRGERGGERGNREGGRGGSKYRILHLALLVSDRALGTRILTSRAFPFSARISPKVQEVADRWWARNAAGVRMPNAWCGRTVLYSHSHLCNAPCTTVRSRSSA